MTICVLRDSGEIILCDHTSRRPTGNLGDNLGGWPRNVLDHGICLVIAVSGDDLGLFVQCFGLRNPARDSFSSHGARNSHVLSRCDRHNHSIDLLPVHNHLKLPLYCKVILGDVEHDDPSPVDHLGI